MRIEDQIFKWTDDNMSFLVHVDRTEEIERLTGAFVETQFASVVGDHDQTSLRKTIRNHVEVAVDVLLMINCKTLRGR
jgi:hypothetical protein